MEASDLKAARRRLLLKRNELIKGLRARHEAWSELYQVCRDIAALDDKLNSAETKPRELGNHP